MPIYVSAITFLTVLSLGDLKEKHLVAESTLEESEIFSFSCELLKKSLESITPECCYYFRDDSEASYIMDNVFSLCDIQVVNLDANFRENISRYPVCGGYIIAVKNFGTYHELFEQETSKDYLFEPHKRVILFVDENYDVDVSAHLILHAVDLLAVEGFKMRGPHESSKPSPTKNITVKSYTRNKILLKWQYGTHINIDPDVLKPIDWPPDFRAFDDPKLKLKIASFNCPPFVLFNDDPQPYGGLEFEILKKITGTWPVEYIRVETFNEYNVSNNKWGSVLAMVADGVAHIGTCSQWSTVVPNYNLEMTYPYVHICGTFLVRRPDVKPDHCYLLHPYNTLGGLVILLLSFIISILLFIVDRLDIRKKEHFNSKDLRYSNILMPYLHVVRLFTIGSLPVYPKNRQNAMRCLWLAWSLLCGILAVHYAASITSSMTIPTHLIPLNKLRDVIRYGIHWRESEPSLKNYFSRSGCRLLKKLSHLYEQGNKRDAIRDNSAIVVKVLLSRYITDIDELDKESLAHSKLISQCFGHYYSVFPLSRKSPLKKPFDEMIMRFIEHGFIDFWFRESIRQHVQQPTCNFFLSYDENIAKDYINMGKIQGSFYLLLAGHLLGLIAFLFELFKCINMNYCLSKGNLIQYRN